MSEQPFSRVGDWRREPLLWLWQQLADLKWTGSLECDGEYIRFRGPDLIAYSIVITRDAVAAIHAWRHIELAADLADPSALQQVADRARHLISTRRERVQHDEPGRGAGVLAGAGRLPQ